VVERKHVRDALAGVVAAARVVLDELDSNEVPASLRRAAAVKGGRLPPPLASALLAELDENEWLRGKVAETLGDDADPVTRAFLSRHKGWWEAVAVAVAERGMRDAERSARQATADITSLRVEAEEARRRAGAKTISLEQTVAALKRDLAAARSDQRRSGVDDASAVDDLRAALASARTELESERTARIDAESRLVSATERLLKVRRGRESGPGRSAEAIPADPVAMARLLDAQASTAERRQASPRAADGAASREGRRRRLSLPAGMSPESPEAVRWLLQVEPPVHLIVDGYNVLFHVDERRTATGASRQRLNDALRRLRRQSGARPAITVVYDSRLAGGRRERSGVGEIEIRFAEEGVTADDEIVDLAAGAGRVAVVSSDRDVQERASASGAVLVWAEALAALITG
jgi:predicted RNA-binding protein with PIN domain